MARMKKENIIKQLKQSLKGYCEGFIEHDEFKMKFFKVGADYFCWEQKVNERLTLEDYNELKEYRDSLLVGVSHE